MKLLVFGKDGQVGTELCRALMGIGELTALNRSACDFNHPDAAAQAVTTYKPDMIINAAAYTAVDKAESEQELAHTINAHTPAAIAHAAKQTGARLIHISTDYVFDGKLNRPYRETDAAQPINAYGRSKKAGEDAITASGCEHMILRTSWVYGAAGKNFIKTILQLAETRDTLNVVNDQIGAPTGAAMIADVIALIITKRSWVSGLYHMTARGDISWHGYARFIVETARGFGAAFKLTPQAIMPIPSKDYPTPAQRPLNSRLDCSKFQETFGFTLPQWQNGVVAMLRQHYGLKNDAA